MCSKGFTEHVTLTDPRRRWRRMDCTARCVAQGPESAEACVEGAVEGGEGEEENM